MFDIDEEQLITRTQHGDSEAFNPLVVKYQSRIYTHILGRIKDREIAKDLTQDTFFKAFVSILSFRGDSAFYSWLYRIAENTCIDFLRKQKAKYDIIPLHIVNEHHITDTHPDTHDTLQRQELQRILKAAIQHLPSTRKRVFLLRYVQELSIKKIATVIDRSEGTVKTHLYKAHHQLRDLLTPYLKNEDLSWLV